MTQRVLMLRPEDEPGLSQAAALAEHDHLRVAFVDRSGGITADILARHSLLLVWIEDARPASLPMILQAARSIRTVLALTRATFLEASGVIDYFDAALFVDQPIARQVAALDAAQHGYVLLPDFIDSRFTPDTLRLAGARALGPRERAVLARLAIGATNSAISQTLGISEATAKGLVRAVLKKLHLRNRTEAALFAVRNGGRLDGAKLDSVSHAAFGLTTAPVYRFRKAEDPEITT